jgi:hypothetical protein
VSRLRRLLQLALIAPPLGVPLPAGAATAPSAQDLARCAVISAPDARLACYDALAGRGADRAGTATAPPAAVAASTTPNKSALTTASAASAPAATTAPSGVNAPFAPAAPAADDPRNFGLTQTQQHAAPVGPSTIQARISKVVDSRTGHGYVVLDNGQTWMLTDQDEDARLGAGDLVTIKRASLGSFLMLTPSKRSYHVRRTQ